MLKFDGSNHTYTLDGQVIPGVTTILNPLTDYSKVPKPILEKAAARGNYIHKACEMFCWGTLDETDIEEDYQPYIDSFKLFMEEIRFEPEFIEERVYHPKLKYAGTFDLGGILHPFGRAKKAHRVQIDIKTTFAFMPSVGPQTAAYNEAWNYGKKKNLSFDKRFALRLKKDGYELLPLRDSGDMNIFLSCLNIYNFMRKNHE